MIITTPEELRLYIPNHALDDVTTLAGYFDAAEHDTLQEKIGHDLYVKVLEHYATRDISDFIDAVNTSSLTDYYDRLLQMCQRIVAFDAMRSAVGTMALSVNGAGLNIATADDYGKPDKDALNEFKNSCNTNLHKSINVLLQTLEQWVKDAATATESEATTSSDQSLDTATVSSGASAGDNEEETVSSGASAGDTESPLAAIVTAWKASRYYYLSAGLIIPCATVLQEYLNFYENREKFIQMLPDLRYIQEDIISDRIGEELVEWFVSQVNSGTTDTTVLRCVDKLRKTAAMLLEARTNVLSTSAERKQKAHDESLALIEKTAEFIDVRQTSLPSSAQAALKLSPLYRASEESNTQAHYEPKFRNNQRGNAMFVMPGI